MKLLEPTPEPSVTGLLDKAKGAMSEHPHDSACSSHSANKGQLLVLLLLIVSIATGVGPSQVQITEQI